MSTPSSRNRPLEFDLRAGRLVDRDDSLLPLVERVAALRDGGPAWTAQFSRGEDQFVYSSWRDGEARRIPADRRRSPTSAGSPRAPSSRTAGTGPCRPTARRCSFCAAARASASEGALWAADFPSGGRAVELASGVSAFEPLAGQGVTFLTELRGLEGVLNVVRDRRAPTAASPWPPAPTPGTRSATAASPTSCRSTTTGERGLIGDNEQGTSCRLSSGTGGIAYTATLIPNLQLVHWSEPDPDDEASSLTFAARPQDCGAVRLLGRGLQYLVPTGERGLVVGKAAARDARILTFLHVPDYDGRPVESVAQPILPEVDRDNVAIAGRQRGDDLRHLGDRTPGPRPVPVRPAGPGRRRALTCAGRSRARSFSSSSCSAGCRPPAARVDRIEILRRSDVAGGKPFGSVGPYEKIVARVHLSVRPDNPHNRPIVDLPLAPRNARGAVEAWADLFLLIPKDAARGNGTLLLEIPNRGGKGILSIANRASGSLDPSDEAHFGDGFLMNRGFAVAGSAGSGTCATKRNRMRLSAPVVSERANPIRGMVRSDFIVTGVTHDQPLGHVISGGLGGMEYEVADPDHRDNVLTVRDTPMGVRQVIPRTAWSFARAQRPEAPDGGTARRRLRLPVRLGARAAAGARPPVHPPDHRVPAGQDLRAGLPGPGSPPGGAGVRGGARPDRPPQARPAARRCGCRPPWGWASRRAGASCATSCTRASTPTRTAARCSTA